MAKSAKVSFTMSDQEIKKHSVRFNEQDAERDPLGSVYVKRDAKLTKKALKELGVKSLDDVQEIEVTIEFKASGSGKSKKRDRDEDEEEDEQDEDEED